MSPSNAIASFVELSHTVQKDTVLDKFHAMQNKMLTRRHSKSILSILSILSVTICDYLHVEFDNGRLAWQTCSVVALVASMWFAHCWDGSIIRPVDERAHCHVQNDTPQSSPFFYVFRWEKPLNFLIKSIWINGPSVKRDAWDSGTSRHCNARIVWGSDSNKKTMLKMKFSTLMFNLH